MPDEDNQAPDDDKPVPDDENPEPDDADLAAERADEIMESLERILAIDGSDIPDALRSADAELVDMAARFAAVHWLLPVLACYRGFVRLELWQRLGGAADLDAACDLLCFAVESVPEPDASDVFCLLQAVGSRLEKAPSPADRDIFISWGSWLLAQVPGEPEEPDGPLGDHGRSLRYMLACLLHDRAESGDGDRAADLDAAIGHFEALVATAPDGPPDGELLGLLVSACWDRMDGDSSQYDQMDRLVRHAREAWAAPGLPDDARAPVGLYLGTGLSEQIRRPDWQRDMSSLDLAVSALSEVLPDLLDDPDVSRLAESTLGVLWVVRGQVSGDAADLAAAEPHLVRAATTLPIGDPDWSDTTYNLALGESVLATLGLDMAHSDQALRLLRAAAEHPPADPEKAAMIHLGLGCVLLGRMTGRRGPEVDEGIEHLTIAYQMVPHESATRILIAWNLSSTMVGRFSTTGDRQDLQAAQFYFDVVEKARTGTWSGALAHMLPDADALSAAVRGQIALAHYMDGNPAAADEGVESLRTAVRLVGPDHPLAARLRSDLGMALLIGFGDGRRSLADLQEGAAALEAAARQLPHGDLMGDMTRFRAACALSILALTARDPRAMREATVRLRQVRADWGEGAGDPLRVTAMLALIHAELYGMTGDGADLAAAREWFTTATAEFEQQPGHPQHGTLLIRLARLERHVGAGQAAIQTGLAALRVRARDVLLQTGPAHGLAAARIAAVEAAEIAGWCLADGAAALAVEALELGRGLVLHAATSAANMPELLVTVGREDLAGEWHRLMAEGVKDQPWDRVAEPGDVQELLAGRLFVVPSGLRERTLNALGADALVAPPGHREIAAALTRTGADALVYLLPPTDGAAGRALIVPADGGDPREVPLPLLHPKTSGALDQYEAAHASLLAVAPDVDDTDGEDNDRQPAPDGGQQQSDRERAVAQWQHRLGLLCEWAWTAVLGTLLGEVPRAAVGGPPRLVLVPVGRLGIVPWHAARRPVQATLAGLSTVDPGGGWRYAIADAVFSYAASGRQLAEVSRRPVRPLTEDPVIVAPEKNMTCSMLLEALALRDRYPNARYLGFASGDQVDGLAMPKEVLGVLPTRERAGASMLHLVCHGVATSAGAEASCLFLEGGRTLTVKAIIRQAYGMPGTAPGGLVNLAACRTDLTAADHDEALTLATAFLAAGAVTVVGSRWEIPDPPSAVLMFMYHHFLAGEGCSPRDALRRAQLWMIDPGRVPPSAMPAVLRKRLDPAVSAELTDVMAWAGLTHQGQ